MIPQETLHSNLVIFKFNKTNINESVTPLYIPIWLYSNLLHPQRLTD